MRRYYTMLQKLAVCVLSLFLALGFLPESVVKAAVYGAVVSDVTVSGTVGSAITNKEFTITLNGGTFITSKEIIEQTGITINNPKGLNISYISKTDNTLTVSVSGIPAETSDKTFAITIPGSLIDFGGADLNVNENSNAKWAITAAAAPSVHTASSTPAGPGWIPSYMVRFLDCNGKKISDQWVAEGQPAAIPSGYSYGEEELNWVYRNLTVSPIGCKVSGFTVPDTADRG